MQNTRREAAWHFSSLKVKVKRKQRTGEKWGDQGAGQKEPCKLLKDSDLYIYLYIYIYAKMDSYKVF